MNDREPMAHAQPMAGSPWHEGELAIQRRLGVAERMDDIGRKVIRDFMSEQHRSFYSQLPFVVLGAVDHDGRPWATIRTGHPGFLHSPDPASLTLDLSRDPGDPADAGMEEGRGIALLGIELHTRRRNRLNGIVRRRRQDAFDIEVAQAFGNCPRFISPRSLAVTGDVTSPPMSLPVRLPKLVGRAAEMVSRADTFFVATSILDHDGIQRPDASHRGGEAGFVRIDPDGGLTIPDYPGNRFFNTLGNLLMNPQAGLLSVDFDTGDLLQMAGRVQVMLSNPEPRRFPEAERLWRFQPEVVLHRPASLPLRLAGHADDLGARGAS
jgi:uncharacterized protein